MIKYDKNINYLKKFKKETKTTSNELSVWCGVSRSYISLVENKKENPSQELVDKIANYFSSKLNIPFFEIKFKIYLSLGVERITLNTIDVTNMLEMSYNEGLMNGFDLATIGLKTGELND